MLEERTSVGGHQLQAWAGPMLTHLRLDRDA